MEFTFGIITSGNNFHQIKKIIESIKNLSIKNYEILIIGGDNTYETEESVIFHPFNDELKKGWITKKKNIITKKGKYENIVYLHDYIIFDKNWYKGFLKFGNEYDIAMNKILNKDKKRFRDWTLWPENENFIDDFVSQKLNCLLPYNADHLSEYMYISGTYWVAKKKVMEEFPLNEKLLWGEGEDVEWSKRVRQKYKFKMNKYSKVTCLKQKRNDFKKTSLRDLNKINKYINNS
tara:strand:- start:6170 stop:6871 length:702 start_codon:yes stop_codon:yes gene_type:complete